MWEVNFNTVCLDWTQILHCRTQYSSFSQVSSGGNFLHEWEKYECTCYPVKKLLLLYSKRRTSSLLETDFEESSSCKNTKPYCNVSMRVQLYQLDLNRIPRQSKHHTIIRDVTFRFDTAELCTCQPCDGGSLDCFHKCQASLTQRGSTMNSRLEIKHR